MAGKEAEDAPLPLELPISDVAERANRNISVCCATFVACSAWVFGAAPGAFVFEPLGALAAFYSLFLFIFQNFYYEWPALNAKVLLLVVLGHLAFLWPPLLESAGLWADVRVRWLVRAADVAFIVWTYVFMIRGPTPADLPAGSMKGLTCIITGCNTGIGYETADAFARAGATVVFACRSEDRARDAMRRLAAAAGGAVAKEQLIFLKLDVSDFSSVRRFTEDFKALKLPLRRLVLNAGVMLRNRSLSPDGIEMTMASNHLGHFLLVQLLLPNMLALERQGVQPRIVCVGSNICYWPSCFDWSEMVVVKGEDEKRAFLQKEYHIFRVYGQSKLAQIHFVTELDRRLRKAGSKIPVNAVHPGEVMTEVMRDMNKTLLMLYGMFRYVMYAFLKTAPQGAMCTVHVATSPALASSDGGSGAYWVRLSPAPLSKACMDKMAAARLWDTCLQATGATSVL